ncbi:MAG: hypothetical protein AAB426_06390 [Myxococcota bacterium]
MFQILVLLAAIVTSAEPRPGYATISMGGEVVAVEVSMAGITTRADPATWLAPDTSGSKSSTMKGSVYDAVTNSMIEFEVTKGETETAGAFIDRFFELLDKLEKEVRERAQHAGIDYDSAKDAHKKTGHVGLILHQWLPLLHAA